MTTSSATDAMGGPSSQARAASLEPPRLNPFALSSDTTSRFWMLVMTAALLAWGLGSNFVETESILGMVFELSPEFQEQIDKKTEEFIEEGRVSFGEEDRIFVMRIRSELMNKLRVASKNLLRVSLSAATLACAVTLTIIIYHLLPKTLHDRFKISSLSAQDAPQISTEVAILSQRVGLPRPPTIAVRPGFLNGLALRGKHGPCLVLDGELEWLEKGWGDLNRAVTIHELGHIINRDIWNREIARSSWLALCFTLSITLPIAAVLSNQAALGIGVIRVAGTLVVVWLLWAGLVRMREFFADSRVLAAGHENALARRLSLPEPTVTSRFRMALRMHPSNRERLDRLTTPERLFRVSFRLALLTGVLAGLIAGNAGGEIMDSILILAIPSGIAGVLAQSGLAIAAGAGLSFLVLVLGILLTCYCISAALGVQILRASVADLCLRSKADWGYLRLFRFALLFVAGIELGFLLTPAALMGWGLHTEMVLFTVLMTATVWIWLIQVRAMGRLILGALTNRKRIVSIERFLRWSAALQLAIFLWPALFGRLAIFVASNPELVAMLNRAHHPEGETVTMLTAGGFMFLGVGCIAMAMINIAVFSLVYLWLWRRRDSCSTCGEPQVCWRTIGRRCAGCGAMLASWLYLPTAELLGAPFNEQK